MAEHAPEPVDELPFATPDKARRYRTEHYRGAVGRNWYRCDPPLRRLLHRHLGDEGIAWAEPHLDRIGELMGGRVAELAEETDRNPPRLERYDRWGHDVSRIAQPDSFRAAHQALLENSFTAPTFARKASESDVDPEPLRAAWSYLLDQADIGMACALGTGGHMVLELAEEFAPPDVAARVRELLGADPNSGESAQLLTERTGGSDLAALETTATPDGDAWRLDGLKWFGSNAGGAAHVVLAKPRGAPDGGRGIAPFLVLDRCRDGSRNAVRIRRLKDKLGTRSVASAEVEYAGAEAFLLAADATDGRGLARMMSLTNTARLGIAMMGLGCARRSLVESLCYARSREAFGARLIDQPLMRRTLGELIVQVEAAQALVFDAHLGLELRLAPALSKWVAGRLGVRAASTAVEVHGGNGYTEQWPVARLLRDAQVNPVWEGGDNVLLLDVRRAVVKEQAHLPFLHRLQQAVDRSPADEQETADLVRTRISRIREAVEQWLLLDADDAESRLPPLAAAMAETQSAALLLEQAGWEQRELGDPRKAVVARCYARGELGDRDRLGEAAAPSLAAEHFDDLATGTFDPG